MTQKRELHPRYRISTISLFKKRERSSRVVNKVNEHVALRPLPTFTYEDTDTVLEHILVIGADFHVIYLTTGNPYLTVLRGKPKIPKQHKSCSASGKDVVQNSNLVQLRFAE